MEPRGLAARPDTSPRTAGPGTGALLGEGRTLGLACVLAGVVTLSTVVLPFSPSPSARTGLGVGLGLLGLLLGAGLWWSGGRTPRWLLHTVLVVAWVAVTVCVAASTTDAGRVVTGYGYVWIALFTAWFHRRWAVALHLGGIAVGFGVAVALSDAPAPWQTWTFVVASVGGVAVVLNRLVCRLRRLADHDQLTGLLNRTAFAVAAEQAMARAERTAEPLAVALIDLDGFKLVNDRRGHAAGDRLLVELADAWTRAVRRGDVLGRHGGDEFVLLMPGTTHAAAARVLSRLGQVSGDGRWSAGIAQWQGEPLGEWLRRADAELYTRKGGAGRS